MCTWLRGGAVEAAKEGQRTLQTRPGSIPEGASLSSVCTPSLLWELFAVASRPCTQPSFLWELLRRGSSTTIVGPPGETRGSTADQGGDSCCHRVSRGLRQLLSARLRLSTLASTVSCKGPARLGDSTCDPGAHACGPAECCRSERHLEYNDPGTWRVHRRVCSRLSVWLPGALDTGLPDSEKT